MSLACTKLMFVKPAELCSSPYVPEQLNLKHTWNSPSLKQWNEPAKVTWINPWKQLIFLGDYSADLILYNETGL